MVYKLRHLYTITVFRTIVFFRLVLQLYKKSSLMQRSINCKYLPTLIKREKIFKISLISETARDLARKLPLPIVCGYNRNENIEKLLPSCL